MSAAGDIRTLVTDALGKQKTPAEIDQLVSALTAVVFDTSYDVALKVLQHFVPSARRLDALDNLNLSALITPSGTK